MSKERELLQRILDTDPKFLGGRFIAEIQELLAQPESLREDLGEDLREDLREGISLRDHFAGLAMQGLIAADWDNERVGNLAYNIADAMLAERSKRDA